ncbi:hypothetical protein RJT34_15214 [Clitoria ternatea]|uniref:Ionotropic glutamate receptor C-terminal domain-containing protein n=1 Tax=Clitoria ternatea TaxID=43366 RepID=A0AAN9JRH4_CLITE
MLNLGKHLDSFLLMLCLWPLHVMSKKQIKIPIGVVLDLKSPMGSMANNCIWMAQHDFYTQYPHFETRLDFRTRDSDRDTVTAAYAASDLMKEKVRAIIGPQTSEEARYITSLGREHEIPIISFSATTTTFNSFFIRTAQADSSQVKAIAAIAKAYGWQEIIPIYENTEYGNALIPHLIDALHQVDTRVPYRSVIDPTSQEPQILQELENLKQKSARIFIVHMTSQHGSKLFSAAGKAGMMSEGYGWIVTRGLSTTLDPSVSETIMDTMQGVLGVRPKVNNTQKLEGFKKRWKENRKYSPLTLFGLWAYDTVWALAMAVENSSPDVSLVNTILATKFQGLSGYFNLVGGELEPSVVEVFNVVGHKERVVGSWRAEQGLFQDDQFSNDRGKLRQPIWPGYTTNHPPKLRFAVPVRKGFTEFVKVENTFPSSNTPKISGFVIDVFLEVLNALPFPLSYEFIPVENYGTYPQSPANNQSEAILPLHDPRTDRFHIAYQKFDAGIGDVTIVYDRTNYFDFTLPYLESNVAMVVSMKHDQRRNMWIFLKPLSWDLWLTTGAAFLLTGFVVWFLEHRSNADFRGTPKQQLGIIFWFSFSTLVFAHRERVINNWSRFVLIVWIFVVLIITQSYTASLTSMLTVESLKPEFIDIKEIQKNNYFVGYQNQSFVKKTILMSQLGFNESQLKAYNTLEEYHEALSKGTNNGGVAAIFDESPYIKLFLSKYGTRYAMVGPTYKTDGLSFAFPLKSPLVPYFSKAILDVTEDKGKFEAIKNKYFSTIVSEDQSASTSGSQSLTLLAILPIEEFRSRTTPIGIATFAFAFAFAMQNSSKPQKTMLNLGKHLDSFLLMLCLWPLHVMSKKQIKIPIGVVLDLKSPMGSMANNCIWMAQHDFYAQYPHFETRLYFRTRDSDRDTVTAAYAASDLMKEKVRAIIGPQTSEEARYITSLGREHEIPIISFSATTTTFNSFFIRTAQADSSQVKAIAAIAEAYGWQEIIPIYENTEYGNALIPHLIDALHQVDTRVPYRSVIDPTSQEPQILQELENLKQKPARIFIVHMTSQYGSKLFSAAVKAGMMSEGYGWIVTQGLSTTLDPSVSETIMDTMQGVLGVKPKVNNTQKLEDFKKRWKENRKYSPLTLFGLWAYDTVWALAMAVENSSHDVSLVNTILATKFQGLSGYFNLVGGELEPSVVEVFNVVGHKERVVGYWSPEQGLFQDDQFSHDRGKLRQPIWPGYTTNHPPKLRFAVPVRNGFTEFVKVENTFPSSNTPKISGFVIDVFLEVLNALPFPLSYEFIPVEKSGTISRSLASNQSKAKYSASTDHFHIAYQKFDAAVGDVTIVYDRTIHFDFTLPYLESDVAMVVSMKHDQRQNMWIFLKPLSWDLWLTTGAAFLLTGFVIWLLEHRSNADFKGTPKQQLGIIFWFSFSTLVFAHRFNESQLKAYNTLEEYHEALSKGTNNGGVAAIFDESPYIKLFLSKYGTKYAMVGPTYKTDGLSFVFPLKSPLVPYFSKAILDVTEDKGKFEAIKNKYFSTIASEDQSASTSGSQSLNVSSFAGLFIVSAVASFLSLSCCFFSFLYSQWSTLRSIPSEQTTLWSMLIRIIMQFGREDKFLQPTLDRSDSRVQTSPKRYGTSFTTSGIKIHSRSHSDHLEKTSVFNLNEDKPYSI